MALSSAYTEAYGKLGEFFNKIRYGQAPPQFTQQYLIDIGFKSNKHRAYIPILKALGFLTPEGAPTSRYKDYRDHSKSKKIMGEALKEAYSDIFLIKENPTSADTTTIEGKFKSYHNASDNVATNMRRTFYALLELADLNGAPAKTITTQQNEITHHQEPASHSRQIPSNISPGLHYNIQIHLPATKDIEVYNAIFKSLKEHLF
ncbi:hypothetical protein PSEUDT2_03684 [Stutzerimonas stutzeri]|uniref:DUF5343 domain-containing protein n=1 Tax=Stutzerimonas stutzeri TaxID=316 RepID=UPI00117AED0B|nr:DUF5343 domain-containing protein [Stutzerimonas stutzeri]CAD2256591.1 hypothetical protein PSEUDT2_03684 [Stutzerimonas stutzeri]